MSTFQEKFSLEDRIKESTKIKKKHPGRTPVIVEKATKSNIESIIKKKFLIPDDLTVGQFLYVIRKRIKLSPDKTIFLFVKSGNKYVIPASGELISQIYKEHVSVDGFLYFIYQGESTFGNCYL